MPLVQMQRYFVLLFLSVLSSLFAAPKVELGIDVFFKDGLYQTLKNKRVGLITNHTGLNSSLRKNIDLFKEQSETFTLAAIFFPEHGANGADWAEEKLSDSKESSIPLYSLHGTHRRPTEEMLKGIDVLVYDIQEIGARSYTYATTLYYAMEEAAKKNIPVIVLDRPNPMNGIVVDGPMLKESHRSFLGYINVPYCHGLTVGELATFFNEEYGIGCDLKVIGMRGWKRTMTFSETGLPWVPTSPYIPESDTPFFYASTGILGTMEIVNIGIGYTLPFKIVGAPWIHAETFAKKLNDQKLAGVHFLPFHYKPFYGKYKGESCQGIKIFITDHTQYKPLSVQYLILGVLKTLYPQQVEKGILRTSAANQRSFCQVSGNDEMIQMIRNEKYIAWKLIRYDEKERHDFTEKRKKYLLY